MAIIRHTIPTTNYSKGRGGSKVNKIVIHWIVGSLASADATFKNPQRRASAHYGIENTKIIQWVDEKDTAWHASNFIVNQQSIGIEHSATPKRPATESTHKTSGKLVGIIAKRYNIKLDTAHIVPHKKYSNTQCPGTMNIGKIIKYAKEADMYKGKSAESWYKGYQHALSVATVRSNRFGVIAKRLAEDLDKPIPKPDDFKTILSYLELFVTKVSYENALQYAQDQYKKVSGDRLANHDVITDTLKGEIDTLKIKVQNLKDKIKTFEEPKGSKLPRVTKTDGKWGRFWKPIIRYIFTYKTKNNG